MKSTEGKIVLTLFTKEDGFPDDPTKAFRKHIMPATELQHTFTDLPEGEYVVLAFHDENSNEILDKSKFGFPKEAIALSNHPKIGPPKPSFEKAKIDPSKNPSVTLTMTKPGL